MSIWKWICCHVLGDHAWTCKAEQGIKPTEDELRDGVRGFERYAAMFCEDCGKVYQL